MSARAGRWRVAAMGVLLQGCLGSIYAWSYFQQTLVNLGGWTHSEVAWTFSLGIALLGIAAAAGGVLLPRFGPRPLAITGILLYATGWFVAAFALHLRNLPLLYAGSGILGGLGLGLGYVTPVVTVARWFPDRRGLVTGMVVMGFGLGALAMSMIIAPALESFFLNRTPLVFAGIGAIVGLVGLVAASFLRNPPGEGAATVQVSGSSDPAGLGGVLGSRPFLVVWFLFFCNITAGIALIGFQSPLLQDLVRASDPVRSPAALAAAGASLIAISSLCNGLGRLLWGALADRIGPAAVFRLLLGTQVAAFAGLAISSHPGVFVVLVCYILLCYGGGFGVMPSFVAGTFGPRRMAPVYGAILTAWSCAGVVGPQLIAHLKDRPDTQVSVVAFGLCAVLLAAGLGLSLLLPSRRNDTATRRA